MSVITAIVVDDEATLADYLVEKLTLLWPELKIVGIAHHGRAALALAEEEQPDIAFLDIHMPGLNGLQVAKDLPATTEVVFVTAYDQYAVEAFANAAVDYLLKPVEDSRLKTTIERLKQRVQSDANSDKAALLELLGNALNVSGKPKALNWLRTGLDDTTELISVDEVIYFKSDQKYTSVVTESGEHLIRRSIKDLEAELDPALFWRIHRGIIVRVDQIVSARRDLRGRYTVALRSRAETLRSSQAYGHLFKQM